MPLLDVAVSARNTSGSAQADSERPQKLLRSAWRKSYAGLAAIGVFSIFINVLKLAGPLYVLQILDRVISSRTKVGVLRTPVTDAPGRRPMASMRRAASGRSASGGPNRSRAWV